MKKKSQAGSVSPKVTNQKIVKGGKSSPKTIVKGKQVVEKQVEKEAEEVKIVKPLKSAGGDEKNKSSTKIQTAEGWKRAMQKQLKK